MDSVETQAQLVEPPSTSPDSGAATAEHAPMSTHVQIGPPKTFNPDAMLEAGVGRSAATGAVVGFLLFTVVVGLLGRWIGLNDSGALFLGVFTGFWGGLGFGAMIGSVLAVTRDERAKAEAGAQPDRPL